MSPIAWVSTKLAYHGGRGDQSNSTSVSLTKLAMICALLAGATSLVLFAVLRNAVGSIPPKIATDIIVACGVLMTMVIAIAALLLRLLKRYRSLAFAHEKHKGLIEQKRLQLDAAVANMPQGLCMYDGNQQLIVCNQQYAGMYGLTAEQTKPGTALKTILRQQIAIGNVADPDTYIERRLRNIAENRPYEIVNRLHDGRLISVVHCPMAGGGWVSTHNDVTDQTNREESFRLLFDRNPVPMWVTDRETLRFLAVNDAAIAHYGYTRDQFMSMTVPELRPLEDRERFTQFMRTLEDNQYTYNVGQHRIADGAIIDIAVSSRAMMYAGRKARLAAIHDITKAKATENQLRRTQKFLDAVVEYVPVPILVKDVTVAEDAAKCKYTLVNRAFETLFGIPRSQIVGKTAAELYPKERADFIIAENDEALKSATPIVLSDHAVHTATNGVRTCTATTVTVRDDNSLPQHLITVLQDVTERKRAEGRISRMAHHDHLTDLPNRTTFSDAIDAAISHTKSTGERFVLLSIDLDGFKEANDTYGHLLGDALLCEFSRRLQAAAGDAFAARIGGDEFALLLEGDVEQANDLALRLLKSLKDPVHIDGHTVKAGATIGAAVYPSDGRDAKTLLSNADIALYRGKTAARGTVLFFNAEMGEEIRERRSMQDALQGSIDRHELLLHYQPQETMSGVLVGFEALARWQSPRLGMVPPKTFIPLAEETGFINAMGEWVLREACREAASWPQPRPIAVNISPVQFRNGNLANTVHSILLETGLAPHRLELEVTESVFIDDFSRAISVLSRLKTLGVRIALDDFGSGYSSLSYLHSFAFDKIKIDRAFVSDLQHNRHSMAIVRAIIDLAQSLNIPVLAEGVETESQRSMLLRRGCDEVQGYLVGRPMSIDQYAALVGREVNKLAMSGN